MTRRAIVEHPFNSHPFRTHIHTRARTLCLRRQPALEELLALYEDGVVDPEQRKTFVVAVRDCEDGMEAELEKAVGARLKAVWAAAVKPEVRVDGGGVVGYRTTTVG